MQCARQFRHAGVVSQWSAGVKEYCDNLTRVQLLSTPLLDRHQIGRSQTARRPENFANKHRTAEAHW
jgi:hypothetical protein